MMVKITCFRKEQGRKVMRGERDIYKLPAKKQGGNGFPNTTRDLAR
jgi:hypothetical protein